MLIFDSSHSTQYDDRPISSLETRILLPTDGPINSLAEYCNTGGLKGFKNALDLGPDKIIEEVKNANLRGRGGAGFPAWIKWRGVRDDVNKHKFLVCNGSEGEPGTYKDRYLIQNNPYLLLEGIAIASYAIGVEKAYIGIKAKFSLEIVRLKKALKCMIEANVFDEDFITIVPGPDNYLFGEEKALLEFIDSGETFPRHLPPFMQGVGANPLSHNPTVVNNVESLSNLPIILRHGAEEYKKVGSVNCSGTMLFTLCGDVNYPGVYELPMGTTLRYLIEDLGGGVKNNRELKAVFSGVANRVITPDMLDTPLDFDAMKEAGSGLGSGGFIVYDDETCMVSLASKFSGFLAHESCGQCVPCKTGCANITSLLEKLEKLKANRFDYERIRYYCGKVTEGTRCYLPHEETILISSMFDKFKDEFDAHLKGICLHKKIPTIAKIESFDETDGHFIYSQ